MSFGQWSKCIHVFLIVCALAVPAFAQVDQGRITGTVKDQSGAVIPGVSITAKNERTGEMREALSGEKGDYILTPLKPSLYTVTAMLSGFANAQVTGIQLVVGQAANVDITLKPAGVSQELTVSADAAEVRVETTSAAMGANGQAPRRV